MNRVLSYAALRKSTLFTLMALLFVFMGATLVAGEQYIQPDGRLNQVTHFGGDAFYCVDENFEATTQYSDFGSGGFRLLNMQGQELWFVPALQISAAVAEAKETGGGVLVGEGVGTYGPVSIYAYVTNENDDYFTFSGFDEFGKPNSITFKFCIPVGPIPSDDADEPEEECDPVIFLKGLAKSTGVSAAVPYNPCIEIDDCVPAPRKLLAGKRISQAPLDDCLLG